MLMFMFMNFTSSIKNVVFMDDRNRDPVGLIDCSVCRISIGVGHIDKVKVCQARFVM